MKKVLQEDVPGFLPDGDEGIGVPFTGTGLSVVRDSVRVT